MYPYVPGVKALHSTLQGTYETNLSNFTSLFLSLVKHIGLSHLLVIEHAFTVWK